VIKVLGVFRNPRVGILSQELTTPIPTFPAFATVPTLPSKTITKKSVSKAV
jgi:hypothetical protein